MTDWLAVTREKEKAKKDFAESLKISAVKTVSIILGAFAVGYIGNEVKDNISNYAGSRKASITRQWQNTEDELKGLERTIATARSKKNHSEELRAKFKGQDLENAFYQELAKYGLAGVKDNISLITVPQDIIQEHINYLRNNTILSEFERKFPN